MRAIADGIRRVHRAPTILVCVAAATFVTALPLSLVMRDTLQSSFGHSLAAGQALRGVNTEWWTEFNQGATGMSRTFGYSVIGFAAVLDNLSTLLEHGSRPMSIVLIGSIYLLCWLFLSGGILDRYARNRPATTYEFFAACGMYFPRFLRLAPIAGLTYYVLFRYVHGWLFGDLWDRVTHEMTVERTAFAFRVVLYAVFVGLLAAANVIFDFAKVRAVVEDRRSMIGALAAGIRFVRRNAGAVITMYVLNGCLFAIVLAAYAFASPGATGSAAWMWIGFAISQLYLLARTWVRLVFFASETALFQSRLAYAGYVATPPPVLPDPPIVEQALLEP